MTATTTTTTLTASPPAFDGDVLVLATCSRTDPAGAEGGEVFSAVVLTAAALAEPGRVDGLSGQLSATARASVARAVGALQGAPAAVVRCVGGRGAVWSFTSLADRPPREATMRPGLVVLPGGRSRR